MYRVELTLAAQADLQAIAEFYCETAGTTVANDVLTNIQLAIASLSEQPHRGHRPHELRAINSANELEIIVGKYRVIYLLRRSVVYVIAVFDGRRDVKTHLLNRHSRR